MCDDHYLPNEFNYISYYNDLGDGAEMSDDRHDYYGVSGIPDLRFDGNWYIQVGASEAHADGTFYMSKIDERRTTYSPMAVIVSDYSYEVGSAFAEVKVKLFDDFDPTNHMIRVAIVEEGVGGKHKVLQTMLPGINGTAMTISANGEEQMLTLPITMGNWNVNNLQIIAWVQNDSNKYVVQSGNSFVGEFAVSVGVTGPQMMIAEGDQVTFGDTNIINIGLNPDTFDVSLDTGDLPEGWAANLVYEGMDYQDFSVALDPYDFATFNVVMDTGDTGSGRVVVNIASQGAGEIVETVEFIALAGGTDLLLVSEDLGGYAWDVYAPAIDPTGKTYAIWDRNFAAIAAENLTPYEAVIWETGANGDIINEDDRTALNTYLAGGGKLMLAGENLLEGLYDQAGSARLWYQLKLRFNYLDTTPPGLDIYGQPGTVGDGLDFTLTGGGPDTIALLNGQEAYVTEAFRYGNDEPAGIQTEYGGYMVLTLPWGLERVPTEAERIAIIDGAFDWFGILDPMAADDVPVAGLALQQNVPNPFNPMTKISLRMDQTGSAKLEIFNARGQLVRVLVDGTLAQGDHAIVWNGKTDTGQQAASGTYFYRLTADNDQLTKKMSLIK